VYIYHDQDRPVFKHCLIIAADNISSLNFQKYLYAIFGHFDIFTYFER